MATVISDVGATAIPSTPVSTGQDATCIVIDVACSGPDSTCIALDLACGASAAKPATGIIV